MTNIAVVVFDSLRKDTFDTYFNWLPGEHFEYAWAPSNYTVPVHASLFTGLYPSEVGVHSKNETFDVQREGLPEQLQNTGYSTRAYSENFLFSPLNDFDRGFDEFWPGGRAAQLRSNVFDWDITIEELSGSGLLRDLKAIGQCVRSDCNTIASLRYGWNLKRGHFDGTGEALQYVKSQSFDSNEFFFANLMQTHLPYDPPKSHRSTDIEADYSEKTAETVLAGDANYLAHKTLYEDCARYLSETYKELFDELTKTFDYIITLSDHGELFGEHGAIKHWYGVYPELTHVPLVLYNGTEEQRTRDDLVSLLDVHKTIAAIAGVKTDSRGQDLRYSVDRTACLTEFNGLRKERIRILENRGFSQSTIQEYDRQLRGVALEPNYYRFETPSECKENGTSSVDDPQEKLEKLIDSLDERPVKTDDREFSDEIKEHLEDLGYA